MHNWISWTDGTIESLQKFNTECGLIRDCFNRKVDNISGIQTIIAINILLESWNLGNLVDMLDFSSKTIEIQLEGKECLK